MPTLPLSSEDIEKDNIEHVKQAYAEHQRVQNLPAVEVKIIEDNVKYTITIQIDGNKLILKPNQALDLSIKLRQAWNNLREHNKKQFKKYHGRAKGDNNEKDRDNSQ